MTDEFEFARTFYEEEYTQAMQLAAEISAFRSMHAGNTSELDIQFRRLSEARSKLNQIITDLTNDISAPRKLIEEIKACRDAAELVEPPEPQAVHASAAELSPQPDPKPVIFHTDLATESALPAATEPVQARQEPVVEQARSPESQSAPAAEVAPMQRSAAQNTVVLETIRKAGHEPRSLPKNDPGKRGIKAVVRDELVGKHRLFPMLLTPTEN